MTLPQPIKKPRTPRRSWGCFIWSVVVLGVPFAALAYCAKVDCFIRTRYEIPSPDNSHVAIQEGATCFSGFANTSNGETVLVKKRDGWLPERQVFVTFESPSNVRWLGNDTLEITVNGVNAINLSRKNVKDVKIAYRMRDGLTETVIRTQLAEEQRRTTKYFKNSGTAEALNANARLRFETFIQWAKDHAALAP